MTTQPAMIVPSPIDRAPAGPPSSLSTKLPASPPLGEASAGSHFPRAIRESDTMVDPPAEKGPSAVTNAPASTSVVTWRLADAILLLRAEALTDIESTRIANENRLRSLADDYGLADSPEYAAQAGLVQAMADLEHRAVLELQRTLRRHPLGPWVKTTQGVGEKQGARLIAAIGDPYWHPLHDRPRRVSELWAYAGLHVLHPGHIRGDAHMSIAGGRPDTHPGQTRHAAQEVDAGMGQAGDIDGHRVADAQNACAVGVAPKRVRGQKANWNGDIKMRAFLVAESCIKKRDSPYRPVYEVGRAKYAEATHPQACPRCGPAGKPAQPGSPLSAGHQHARALRLVSKALLRDLWAESRRLHEEGAL